MTIRYFPDLVQGSDEWLAARRGILTASEMKLILTPTLKIANNDKTRAHVWEIAAQRISGHVEPSFVSDDMLRGMDDEFYAREIYAEKVAPVQEMGFITDDQWGFTIGYSPDGLVGDDGLIEVKSRRQKYQIQTICENVWNARAETIPSEFIIQAQTGLLVTGREWLDFVSYSNGLPMAVIRVYPDPKVRAAIIEAATDFEEDVSSAVTSYRSATNSPARLFPTERRIVQEIF